MKHLVFVLAVALGLPSLGGQPDPHRMEIVLERQQDAGWSAVDPGLVLKNGDHVRFRFKASFSGFLHVMSLGTSGKNELLFPREETGEENKIQANKEYSIPATKAWFRIAGPPGYDIVYWLVVPIELHGGRSTPEYLPLPPPPDRPVPPSSLTPRCDDAIFRARGLCIDSSAGPRGVEEDAALPENLARLPRVQSRDLVIMRRKDASLVASPAPQAPLLYEFRIAHR